MLKIKLGDRFDIDENNKSANLDEETVIEKGIRVVAIDNGLTAMPYLVRQYIKESFATGPDRGCGEIFMEDNKIDYIPNYLEDEEELSFLDLWMEEDEMLEIISKKDLTKIL